jgi:hypothetical protein
MPERDPIDLIKDQLSKVEGMTGLHSGHEGFKNWHTETKTILEKVFGTKSIHYQSFAALRFREMSVKAFASPEIDKINTARYKKDLDHVKSLLQSAIKELTLDRTLFKRIQTTPTTVEFLIKGEYFLSSGIQQPEIMQAIESAFEGSGLSPIYGAQNVNQRTDQIRLARFGIYNLSVPERADVLLELGMALALGKEILIICGKDTPLPESLKPLKRIEYESPSDLTEKLKEKKLG